MNVKTRRTEDVFIKCLDACHGDVCRAKKMYSVIKNVALSVVDILIEIVNYKEEN